MEFLANNELIVYLFAGVIVPYIVQKMNENGYSRQRKTLVSITVCILAAAVSLFFTNSLGAFTVLDLNTIATAAASIFSVATIYYNLYLKPKLVEDGKEYTLITDQVISVDDTGKNVAEVDQFKE